MRSFPRCSVFHALAALPLGVTLAACDPDFRGAGGVKAEDEFKCIETVRELDGLDAALPEGGTVRDRVGMTLGSHAFEFRVPENQKPATTYTPNSNGVKGRLELAFGAGKIRYIESKKPQLPKGLMLALYCPNRMEVEVSMNLRSEDGAFAETLNTVLHREFNSTQNPNMADPERLKQAWIRAELPLHGRSGSFAIQTPSEFTPENTKSQNLRLHVLWENKAIKKSELTATWMSKPKQEGPGETSAFGVQMDVYSLVFSP